VSAPTIQAVLFDLDGTLIDSAPDLAGAINTVRVARGLEPVPFEQLRPMVGAGARGMVGAAFGLNPGDDGFADLREAFLRIYERDLLVRTRVFDEMQPVLQRLDDAGLPWGIVTNKAALYTLPIVQGLGLAERAKALVCGDTTPHSKPHPEPLLEAARRIGCEPAGCVYVGDDLRDVTAAHAAGMPVLAAAWGYLGEGPPIDAWGAHAILADPAALLHWLGMA
jgi:N-acetyl-D-muramate 6-phosphate phosphatase